MSVIAESSEAGTETGIVATIAKTKAVALVPPPAIHCRDHSAEQDSHKVYAMLTSYVNIDEAYKNSTACMREAEDEIKYNSIMCSGDTRGSTGVNDASSASSSSESDERSKADTSEAMRGLHAGFVAICTVRACLR